MSIAVITGSTGLVGSAAAEHFAEKGLHIVGIDNDMRRYFFGEEASTSSHLARLERSLRRSYQHLDVDIRDEDAIDRLFRHHGSGIEIVIHCAAQPSHDWAAREPHTDFGINATGTLNLLEATRRFSPRAAFVFMSTNKVYGDTPNRLPLVELETRWEIAADHRYRDGITEEMTIDQSLHSLFGASKLAADVMVQEYGRYFGLATVCFRAGCVTGPHHAGAELHGFLAYLMKCAVTGTPYRVLGYGGKQVRDNIHAVDLVRAFDEFCQAPRPGEVYNIGGGRHSHASLLEAIDLSQGIVGSELDWTYSDVNRKGDHIWWVSNMDKFRAHYPDWQLSYDVERICREIHEANAQRWLAGN